MSMICFWVWSFSESRPGPVCVHHEGVELELREKKSSLSNRPLRIHFCNFQSNTATGSRCGSHLECSKHPRSQSNRLKQTYLMIADVHLQYVHHEGVELERWQLHLPPLNQPLRIQSWHFQSARTTSSWVACSKINKNNVIQMKLPKFRGWAFCSYQRYQNETCQDLCPCYGPEDCQVSASYLLWLQSFSELSLYNAMSMSVIFSKSSLSKMFPQLVCHKGVELQRWKLHLPPLNRPCWINFWHFQTPRSIPSQDRTPVRRCGGHLECSKHLRSQWNMLKQIYLMIADI
jgi:hypothetical protein